MMIKNRKGEASSGFTLVELLVVIAIIAILAAFILNTAAGVQKKAARSRAEAEIAALSAALESYRADNGDYPLSTTYPNSGVSPNSLYGVLSPSSGKVYFEFRKGMTNSSGIVDPFGVAYYYVYTNSGGTNGTNGSPNNGPNFFDLWSTAGSTSSNVWIKNW